MARALAALEEHERRAAALRAPIAVLGWACHLPGGVRTPEALWSALLAGRDLVGPPPAASRRERPQLEGEGGYLEDPFAFDPEAFGLTEAEATLIDPQQRLALTVTREALEDAQLVAPPDTGVYAAASTLDFALALLLRSADPDIEGALAIGASHAAIAGHVSRYFGLKGPSASADAACASGLVALHQATAALRRGQVEVAVVVGVNVILDVHLGRAFRRSGLASEDGRCRAFSADARGYGRAEGAVALVLARAGEGVARGRRERMRVLGIDVQHAGRTAQLGAPSGPSEVAVMRGALADARVDAGRVGFVEAHATATLLGDVVELEALAEVYPRGLCVASAKSALGHAEAASGLIGVLKAGLQLAAGVVAPHLYASPPSPHVDRARLGLEVPGEPRPIAAGALGAVSAFGFTGTHAHVIVGPGEPPPSASRGPAGPRVLALSAATSAHLARQAEVIADALEPGVDWAAFTRALAVGRPAQAVRAALVAADAASARAALRRWLSGEDPAAVAVGTASALARPAAAGAPLEAVARAFVAGAALPEHAGGPSLGWVDLPRSATLERSIGLSSRGVAPRAIEGDTGGGGAHGAVASPRSAAAAPVPVSRAAPAPAARTPREAQLIERVTALLGQEPDLDVPLRELGLESRQALELRAELEQALGRAVPATLILEHPTLARLAAAVDALVADGVEGAAAPQAAAARAPQPPAPRARQVPVAIVGLSCRFPGADDPAAFWALLSQGRHAVRPIPPDRWSTNEWATPPAALLDDVLGFDAAFFGVAPREAAAMDPQQRLLLELAWAALEDALIPPSSLAGTDTGVFVGISSSDYALRPVDRQAIDGLLATGNAHSIAANRISYALDLRGPSMAVDTACSSSLVAVHLACQSLAAQECAVALAGGVNVILAPEPSAAFARAGMLAPDGRCKTFDAAADGYGRGEGAGWVVLKRLADATRDGDRVWAVIRGSAVVQDGRTQGLTAPSLGAQVQVIEAALGRAGLSGADVDVVEAHGTGTPLGDPIEVEALARALGPVGPRVALGAVKTNVGHLEAAAGIAGTIKLALALRHGEVPPNVGFGMPNPHLRWAERRFDVPTERAPWPRRAGRPRRAGQSAFGFGGTNAHVILEEAPVAPLGAPPPHALDPPLLLSARSPEALRALASAVASTLAAPSGAEAGAARRSLGALAADAAHGRDHLRHRAAIVAPDDAAALAALEALAAGRTAAGLVTGQVGRRGPPPVAVMCPGQGTRALSGALERAAHHAAYARALARCEQVLSPWMSLSSRLAAPIAAEDTAIAQPALVAVAWAAAEALAAEGVEVGAVIGHSVGELAALAIAGALSIEDALVFAALRGAAMQALPAGGAMGLVFDDERALPAALCWAADNAPHVRVVSGPRAEVEAFADRLLPVAHAFHSPLIEPALPALAEAAAALTFRAPRVPWASGVTGALTDTAPDAAALVRQARAPVLFRQGLSALRAAGFGVLLDLGTGGTLLELARRTTDAVVAEAAHARAALHVAGHLIAWPGARAGVGLPTQPFQRQRYAIERRIAGPPRASARLSFVDQGDE